MRKVKDDQNNEVVVDEAKQKRKKEPNEKVHNRASNKLGPNTSARINPPTCIFINVVNDRDGMLLG